jgi:hypothetical protein
MDQISNTKRGNEFESQVAALFIAAGYKVDRNPSLPGQQIDLLATNFDNFGMPRRVVVECKFLADGTISNSTVQEFINFVKPLLDRGISSGIMVTNRNYSLPAKHFAASYPFIEIKTYEELEDSLFDFSGAFVSLVNEYQHADIYNQYIDLYCLKEIGLKPSTGVPTASELPRVKIISELLNALSKETSSYFAFIDVVAQRDEAAHPHALLTRGGELVANALADDLALELREGEQDVERQPSHRRRRVERLGD